MNLEMIFTVVFKVISQIATPNFHIKLLVSAKKFLLVQKFHDFFKDIFYMIVQYNSVPRVLYKTTNFLIGALYKARHAMYCRKLISFTDNSQISSFWLLVKLPAAMVSSF